MKVKNINGTSQNKCSCGSWLKHWEKFSNQKSSYCPEVGCTKQDLVGAHVQKANSTDDSWYIVPLCSAHNQSSQTIEIADSCKLVSANKKATCDK